MRALPAAELLEAWERGWSESPPARALTLLDRACPDLEWEALARLSIGQRDRLLMAMREATFGSRVTALATCPECSEQLEFTFGIEDIRVPGVSLEPVHAISLETEGLLLRFRLPDTRDLIAIAMPGDEQRFRGQLIDRCLLSAQTISGQRPHKIPEAVLLKMEEEMSKRDSQASVEIALDCANCHARWGAPFDILAFFWDELTAWAHRLLAEIHTLATRYGWREADILEMSAMRRNIYLNMSGK